ncbi:ABC transporter transmembrane region [Plasmodiophora brassicae]
MLAWALTATVAAVAVLSSQGNNVHPEQAQGHGGGALPSNSTGEPHRRVVTVNVGGRAAEIFDPVPALVRTGASFAQRAPDEALIVDGRTEFRRERTHACDVGLDAGPSDRSRHILELPAWQQQRQEQQQQQGCGATRPFERNGSGSQLGNRSQAPLARVRVRRLCPRHNPHSPSTGGMSGPNTTDDAGDGKAAPASSPRRKPARRPTVSFSQVLFRFTTRKDRVMMAAGVVAAMVAGAAQPLMTIVFGGLADDLGAFQIWKQTGRGTETDTKLQADLNAKVLYFVYLGVGLAVCTYAYVACWAYTAETSANRLRKAYLKATLRQNIAYFDGEGGGSVSTRIIADTQMVQDGIGEKVPQLAMNFSTFVSAFIIAFTKSWQLTLVLICAVPAMGVLVGVFRKWVVIYTRAGLDKYALAGNVAEETLAAVRTVRAFSAEAKLLSLYRRMLLDAERVGIKKQLLTGVVFGMFQFIIYNMYSLAFYYGGTLLINGDLTPGNIVTCYMAVLIGAFTVAGSSGSLQNIGFAIGAATTLYETIDRVPPIDVYSEGGTKPARVDGAIRARQVCFRYPSRPDQPALIDFDLDVAPGQTCALVGSSGSGKSTLFQLLERFYEADSGTVELDGVDVRALNVRWLRTQIGYVTQEPTLFKASIAENVAHGLIGTDLQALPPERQRDLVVDACRQANAHDFISKLPDGYDTQIGERGLLLSGGQKQRIAIARSIVKNPRLLLLDEATSALDTHSERVVQEALDQASKGRTTLVIAHRLSTIRHADKIVVMDQGRVVEQGTHESLMRVDAGMYRRLVDAQAITMARAGLPPSGSHVNLNDAKKVDPDAVQIASGSDPAVVVDTAAAAEQRLNGVFVGGGFTVMWEILRLNAPEARYIAVGLLGAVISGAIMPAFAYIFGRILEVFYEKGPDLRTDTNFWALMFFVISLAGFLGNYLKFTFFGISGEKLTTRIRDRSLEAMLSQEIGWFDEARNSVGALTTSLSSAATQIQYMSGSTLGSMLELCTGVVGAALVSLITGWELALVVLACLPLIVASNKKRMDMMRKGNIATKEYYEKSAQVACEAVGAMRTVASLTREQHVYDLYCRDLVEPLAIGKHHAIYGSVLFALSESMTFLVNAVAFAFGGYLFINHGYTTQRMFTVLMAVIFAGQSSGRVFSMMPDLTKALLYARDVLGLLARTPLVANPTTSPVVATHDNTPGLIEFKDVQFEYPTRPGLRVLRGLSITVQPGQYVALVGASGCGKSTAVGLVERFYDVQAGQVLIDGRDVSSIDLRSLRQVVSIVTQEPSLFHMTVKDNILLGVPDPAAVSQAEIEQAARDANIHDFIASMADGYATNVGAKGGQLSGGQKQRIAIARAIILKPRILLLDESTSALDATSEKVVQAALDQAARGRSTISIAHRLSTIKHADQIYVLQNGVVVEHGTHDELVGIDGLYRLLASQQDLNS